MRKLIFFFLITILFSFQFKTSFAENKIAFLDLDFVLKNSKKGKEVLSIIELKKKNKLNEFKDQELIFQNDEKKLIASQNIISKDQLNINIENFKKKIENYRLFKSEELKKLQDNQNKEIIKFFNSINPLVENYMQINKISILMDKKNIYVADKKLDITLDIIDLVDKKL